MYNAQGIFLHHFKYVRTTLHKIRYLEFYAQLCPGITVVEHSTNNPMIEGLNTKFNYTQHINKENATLSIIIIIVNVSVVYAECHLC
jgi:hypothetical protein